MISDALQKWPVLIVIFLGSGVSQMMMQMPYPVGGFGGMMMPPPPPMMMPPPMPMPFPVPVGIPIPYPESTTETTTTTTTTDSSGGGGDGNGIHGIAIPIPVPHFVQIAMPGFIPPNCQNGDKKKCPPPCPPCTCNPCTPSFFSYCSPCHQECRCKNGKENPSPLEPRAPVPIPGPAFPMPIPMPPQPPIVIIPFPPQFKNPHPPETSAECSSHSKSASCSEESESTGALRGRRRKKRKKKNKSKKKYDIYRRSIGLMKKHRNDDLVHPVLTYMNRNGEIKLTRRLSNGEATELLGEGKRVQNVRITAGEDSNNRPRVVITSIPSMRNEHRQKFQLDGPSQRRRGEERSELILRPSDHSKISNLSLSFQIAK